jgi:hypothetical protein
VRTFRVTYELKGVRIIDVTTKGELPENFNDLSYEQQDEWLYEHQEYSVLHTEDIDYGKAESIVELRRDLRVVS